MVVKNVGEGGVGIKKNCNVFSAVKPKIYCDPNEVLPFESKIDSISLTLRMKFVRYLLLHFVRYLLLHWAGNIGYRM